MNQMQTEKQSQEEESVIASAEIKNKVLSKEFIWPKPLRRGEGNSIDTVINVNYLCEDDLDRFELCVPQDDDSKYGAPYLTEVKDKSQFQVQFCWPVDLSGNVKMSGTDLRSVEGEGQNHPDRRKTGPKLDMVAYQLTHDLINLFLGKQNWALYHPNMILQDNIRGKTYEGLQEYIKIVNLVRLIAHLRFVYVRFHILKITTHPEDNTIRVRWRIAGLGMLRMLVRYFPDRLWMQ